MLSFGFCLDFSRSLSLSVSYAKIFVSSGVEMETVEPVPMGSAARENCSRIRV
jgi:hypothetical protein